MMNNPWKLSQKQMVSFKNKNVLLNRTRNRSICNFANPIPTSALRLSSLQPTPAHLKKYAFLHHLNTSDNLASLDFSYPMSKQVEKDHMMESKYRALIKNQCKMDLVSRL